MCTSDESGKEFDIERYRKLKAIIESYDNPKNNELMERLGSDYDENGKAYWEK
jgi:hypothetical protein